MWETAVLHAGRESLGSLSAQLCYEMNGSRSRWKTKRILDSSPPTNVNE